MTYSHCMHVSLEHVARTRHERITRRHPELTSDAKAALLRDFHPDFNPHIKRPLQVGVNKGDVVAQEVADFLESPSSIQPIMPVLDPRKAHFSVDILIIGSGGAGLAAALWLKKNTSLKVLVSTKLRTIDSNTVMAEGGISAATAINDNPAIHFVDTMVGGRHHNDPVLVESMVSQGPIIIDWLASLGVHFDRRANMEYFTHRPGGHSRTRSHSVMDITGLEIMRVLTDETRNQDIEIKEFCPAVELLVDSDSGKMNSHSASHKRCVGAVLQNLDTKDYYVVHSKAVIIATGGMGRLHPLGFPTSNFYGATADGLVLGYRAGAGLAHMDSIQYHPTGTAWPDHLLGLLISEAVRAQGAQLVNAQGDMFIGNLETRDALASGIIKAIMGEKKHITTPTGHSGVWLDTPLIDMIHGKNTFKQRFANIYARFMACGIDPANEPILISPTQHYQNGGLAIDRHGRTSVPSLYAAGEVTGGVHGKNRLGGNALLDIFVFGHAAAQHAAQYVQNISEDTHNASLAHVHHYHEELKQAKLEGRKTTPILFPDYRHTKLQH